MSEQLPIYKPASRRPCPNNQHVPAYDRLTATYFCGSIVCNKTFTLIETLERLAEIDGYPEDHPVVKTPPDVSTPLLQRKKGTRLA